VNDIGSNAVELHNEAIIHMLMMGHDMKEALAFVYPDPTDERTWLCYRRTDS